MVESGNLTADRGMIASNQPCQLHDANSVATTNQHEQRKQRTVKRDTRFLKEGAIVLWLIDQPDELTERVIVLANVLVHMGVVYTDFIYRSSLFLLR